jgi:hypothetical protein
LDWFSDVVLRVSSVLVAGFARLLPKSEGVAKVNVKTYEKLAAVTEREIADIDYEMRRLEQRLAELRRERAYKASGLVGIHYEIKQAKELNDDN